MIMIMIDNDDGDDGGDDDIGGIAQWRMADVTDAMGPVVTRWREGLNPEKHHAMRCAPSNDRHVLCTFECA